MIQISFIYLKNRADFAQYLSETKGVDYILIDPSNINDPVITRRLMRRSSVCLFEGSDWDNMDMLAPYIVREADLFGEEKESILGALSSGHAILLSSSKDIQELKRYLKKFITQPSEQKGKLSSTNFILLSIFCFILRRSGVFKRFLTMLTLCCVEHLMSRTNMPRLNLKQVMSSNGKFSRKNIARMQG